MIEHGQDSMEWNEDPVQLLSRLASALCEDATRMAAAEEEFGQDDPSYLRNYDAADAFPQELHEARNPVVLSCVSINEKHEEATRRRVTIDSPPPELKQRTARSQRSVSESRPPEYENANGSAKATACGLAHTKMTSAGGLATRGSPEASVTPVERKMSVKEFCHILDHVHISRHNSSAADALTGDG